MVNYQDSKIYQICCRISGLKDVGAQVPFYQSGFLNTWPVSRKTRINRSTRAVKSSKKAIITLNYCKRIPAIQKWN